MILFIHVAFASSIISSLNQMTSLRDRRHITLSSKNNQNDIKPLFVQSRFSNPRSINNSRKTSKAPPINFGTYCEQSSFDSLNFEDEKLGMGSYTINELAHDYDFPIDWLVSSVVRLGVSPPVDLRTKLSEMLHKDAIFAIFEALNTMDPSEARMQLCDHSLTDIAGFFDVSVAHVFALCGKLKLDLPMGIRTFLRRDEYATLTDALEDETGIAGVREKPDLPVDYPDLVTDEAKLDYYGLKSKEDMARRNTDNEANLMKHHQQNLGLSSEYNENE